jgi:glutathione synthase/RimK-type ligase-like ATP-grasp enzyme
MNLRIIGVYREPEFSPGKIDADAAIIDEVLAHLRSAGAETEAIDSTHFTTASLPDVHLVIAMCQGAPALSRLASMEQGGAVTINSALAIRNCYRDLLSAGLTRAGVPTPDGALVRTAAPLDLKALRALDLSSPIYIKRGNLHALGPNDVQRVEDLGQLQATMLQFARREIDLVYLQQEVSGEVVKFYGVGAAEYFSAVSESGLQLNDSVKLALAHAASTAALALGLEVWGGDAVVTGDSFRIIDFNDWPSFERVRDDAAPAIARRCLMLLRQHPLARDLAL